MLHLLIVDDEPLAVRGVKAAVEWESIGISDVYEANDAAEAKEIMDRDRVDIVLCDIEMPQESGMDLLSWIRERKPSVETIFLTCHADFGYAKRAIQLGSLDYLLKPISPEDLKEVIAKAVDKVVREKEQAQRSQSWDRHHPLFLERFWLDVIHQVIPSSQTAVRQAMAERRIAFADGQQVLPVLIDVQRWHKPLTLRDEKILEYGLKNAAEEMLRERGLRSQQVSLDRNRLLTLILADPEANGEAWPLKDLLERYIASCNLYFYCDMSCYAGNPVSIHELSGMVDRLNNRMKNNVAFYNSVIRLDDRALQETAAAMPDMKIWSLMLLQDKADTVLAEAEDYLKRTAKRYSTDATFLHRFHQDFLQIVYSVLKEKGIQAHELFNDSRSVEMSSKADRSIMDMLEWIRHILAIAAAKLGEMAETFTVAEKVKRYIHRHFDQDLSREEIAGRFFLNPDYLDRILKKETGMSMKECQLHERLRVAQELLAKTDMPVTGVATHVGINNLSHFTRVFRKHTGLNPSEYKQSGLNRSEVE